MAMKAAAAVENITLAERLNGRGAIAENMKKEAKPRKKRREMRGNYDA